LLLCPWQTCSRNATILKTLRRFLYTLSPAFQTTRRTESGRAEVPNGYLNGGVVCMAQKAEVEVTVSLVRRGGRRRRELTALSMLLVRILGIPSLFGSAPTTPPHITAAQGAHPQSANIEHLHTTTIGGELPRYLPEHTHREQCTASAMGHGPRRATGWHPVTGTHSPASHTPDSGEPETRIRKPIRLPIALRNRILSADPALENDSSKAQTHRSRQAQRLRRFFPPRTDRSPPGMSNGCYPR